MADLAWRHFLQPRFACNTRNIMSHISKTLNG